MHLTLSRYVSTRRKVYAPILVDRFCCPERLPRIRGCSVMQRLMGRSIVGALLVVAVVLCAGCASVEEPAVEQEPAVAQEPTVADQLAFPAFEWDSYLFPNELFPFRDLQPADVFHLARYGSDTVAMLELWRRYYEGDGAVKNRSRAMHWLSEAASGGHAYAMLVIARPSGSPGW